MEPPAVILLSDEKTLSLNKLKSVFMISIFNFKTH